MSKSVERDLRTAPRIRLTLPAEFRSPTALEMKRATCRDLSVEGMFLRSGWSEPVGTLLSVECELPHSQQHLKLVGRVVRHEAASDGDPGGMGVAFVRVHPESRKLLTGLLASVHPSLLRVGGAGNAASVDGANAVHLRSRLQRVRATTRSRAQRRVRATDSAGDAESRPPEGAPVAAAAPSSTLPSPTDRPAPAEGARQEVARAPAASTASAPASPSSSEPAEAGLVVGEPAWRAARLRELVAAQPAPQVPRLPAPPEAFALGTGETPADAREIERAMRPSALAASGASVGAGARQLGALAAAILRIAVEVGRRGAPLVGGALGRSMAGLWARLASLPWHRLREHARPLGVGLSAVVVLVLLGPALVRSGSSLMDSTGKGVGALVGVVDEVMEGVVVLAAPSSNQRTSSVPAPETAPGQPQQQGSGPLVLDVVTTPPGARVTVDGKTFDSPGRVMLSEELEPPIRVQMTRPGYRLAQRDVYPELFKPIDGMRRYRVEVVLERRAAPGGKVSAAKNTEAGEAPASPLGEAQLCVVRGDRACAVAALEGRASTPAEHSLLIESYLAVGKEKQALRAMAMYLERFPSRPEAAAYRRQLALTVPDAPF